MNIPTQNPEEPQFRRAALQRRQQAVFHRVVADGTQAQCGADRRVHLIGAEGFM